MAETHSDGVVETFADARVVQHGDTSYYLPLEAGEIDRHQDETAITARHPALVSFTRTEESKRDPSRRAIYWALLQERVGESDENFPLTYDSRLVELESADDIQIPWKIALTTNKAVYAAYLAVHGKPNSFLADALGVTTGTVSQYLSDFKSERR